MNHTKDRTGAAQAVLLTVWLVALVILRNFTRMHLSPLMETVMEEMSISYTQAGMLVNISGVLMGLSMLFGSRFVDRIGAFRTLMMSYAALAASGVFCLLFRSYTLVLAGRIFAGFGEGLSWASIPTVIAACYEKKYRGALNLAFGLLNGFSVTGAFMVTLPLYRLLGSWRYVSFFWSLLAAVFGTLFCIWQAGRQDTAVGNKEKEDKGEKEASSIRLAWAYPQVKCFLVTLIGTTFVFQALTTYLPTFLRQVYNASPQAASSITGMLTFWSAGASILHGIFMRRCRSRRAYLSLLVCCAGLGTAAFSFAPGLAAVQVLVFLVGCTVYSWIPQYQTIIMYLPGMEPRVVGGAIALIQGVAGLATIVLPYAFDFLAGALGMRYTYLCMAALLLPGLLCMMRVPGKLEMG